MHPFCEGNTRTTAVFIIKYLRTFGFNINDEVFAELSQEARIKLKQSVLSDGARLEAIKKEINSFKEFNLNLTSKYYNKFFGGVKIFLDF